MRDFRCFALWHPRHDRPVIGVNGAGNIKILSVHPDIESATRAQAAIKQSTGKELEIVGCVLIPVIDEAGKPVPMISLPQSPEKAVKP